jgi:pyruvate/2-oxoglutarate dehydrogenase complex dihydrolipoamide acyltransferase (E2) component
MSFRRASRIPAWRKLALTTWDTPSNPAAYGVLDLDCERALDWAARVREASGEKVTLTHVVGKAAAIAMASSPEANGFASFGRLMLRETVDVFFQVAFFDGDKSKKREKGARSDANLAGAKVREVDRKSLAAIARELRERAEAIRQRGDAETAKASQTMARLPGPLVGAAARLGSFLSYDLGLDLRRFGIPFDAFGSCMVTNVGVFGINVGHAPLFPLARVPIIMTLGSVHDAPAVMDGKVVVRKRVNIGVAFDHRVMDGYHAGVMAKRFEQVFADPGSADRVPAGSVEVADEERERRHEHLVR